MGSSILIVGGSANARQAKIEELLGPTPLEPGPDIRIEEPAGRSASVGIKNVRMGIEFLQERPYAGKRKTWVILDGKSLTVPAQNALLKTLEEPPNYATIILGAQSEKDLLPTVVSRCRKTQVVQLANDIAVLDTTQTELSAYSNFPTAEIGNKLELATELAKEERSTIIAAIESWIVYLRRSMRTEPDPTQVANIELLLQIKTDLENTNVNTQLALDYLATNMK